MDRIVLLIELENSRCRKVSYRIGPGEYLMQLHQECGVHGN